MLRQGETPNGIYKYKVKQSDKRSIQRQTWVLLSLLARAAAILGATLRVRVDIRRCELDASSSMAAELKTRILGHINEGIEFTQFNKNSHIQFNNQVLC